MAKKEKRPRGKAQLVPNACIACGRCEAVCPVNAIAYGEKGEPIIDLNKCIGCGKCAKSCPAAALRMAYPEAGSVVVEHEDEGSDTEKEGLQREDHAKGVWVFVEQRHGAVRAVSWELLGKGRDLAGTLSEQLSAVILGSGTRGLADEAFAFGADNVYSVDHPVLAEYRTQPYAESIVALARKYFPAVLLVGATALGRDLASAVATKLETGLTADCTELSIDREKRLLEQTRPAFGGNIMATIVCENARPQMASVRPGVFPVPPFLPGRKGRLVSEACPTDEARVATKVLETSLIEKSGVDIGAADIVVSGGRGMESREHFGMLADLAELLGGVVAGSRSAVDAGWIEYERQVGQTGRIVRPKLYIACAISGAIQHLVGMQSAEYVIAINRDAAAPIFERADLAVVGDVFEIIPGLIAALGQKKAETRGGGES